MSDELFTLYPESSLHERALRQRGYQRIAGVDEVGRGPLAGPVYACAVVIPQDFDLPDIRDSKKLSARKRERLAAAIQERCDYALGVVEAPIIDEVNILEATKRAMKEALEGLAEPPDCVLIDALEIPGIPWPQEGIVHGDASSVSIAAASIVAKVARDALMLRYDELYPGYGFAQHKGYGTKAHREAIIELGPSPIHRRSFLSKVLAEREERLGGFHG